MAGKSGGLLSRVLSGFGALLNRRQVVGIDIHGNKYLRWEEKNLDGDVVEKRIVKTLDGSYNPSLIPPEWTRWLQKTRLEHPTQEEIEEANKRRMLMKQRVMVLEAQEVKRRLMAEGMQRAADSPNLDRFVQQLTARGYAPGQTPPPTSPSPADGGPSAETEPRSDQAPPQPPPPPPSPSQNSEPPRRSSGGGFEPETWKPPG